MNNNDFTQNVLHCNEPSFKIIAELSDSINAGSPIKCGSLWLEEWTLGRFYCEIGKYLNSTVPLWKDGLIFVELDVNGVKIRVMDKHSDTNKCFLSRFKK